MTSLSLASHHGLGLLGVLGGLLLGLGGLVLSCGLLHGGLLGLLGGTDGLLPLCLPHLGLLVPLGHDFLEGGADHGALELVRRVLFLVTSSSSPFLCFLR